MDERSVEQRTIVNWQQTTILVPPFLCQEHVICTELALWLRKKKHFPQHLRLFLSLSLFRSSPFSFFPFFCPEVASEKRFSFRLSLIVAFLQPLPVLLGTQPASPKRRMFSTETLFSKTCLFQIKPFVSGESIDFWNQKYESNFETWKSHPWS